MIRWLERPASGEPAGALVFFHGYYGIPDDFLPFLGKLDPERRFHGYLPQGPHLVGDGRGSWIDIEAPEPPLAQLEPVAAWLDALPFPAGRTVLGGWSQGTSVAYALALGTGRERPAGLLALGGWLPDDLVPELDLDRTLPPIRIAHGAADRSVPVERAREARDRLAAAGADVCYRESPVGHEIDPQAIPDLRAFVAALP